MEQAMQDKNEHMATLACLQITPELIRVIELAEEALSQWISATGGQYDPVKERITEQALSEIRKLRGE